MASCGFGSFMTNQEKLLRGIWPWTKGARARLPLHYKLRHIESVRKDPEPVHFRPEPGKWKLDQHKVPTRIQNIPVPVIYPRESLDGLWGGEGIIEGTKKRKNNPMKPAIPHIWKPKLLNHLFYSEILDKWFDVVVTNRTLAKVDEAFGFDFYILKTHEVDLKSRFGMRLKQKMLKTLSERSMWANSPSKCEEVYDRYKEYLIPPEEIEWVGLSLNEAEGKLLTQEEADRVANTLPLKEQYMEELLAKIQNPTLGDQGQGEEEEEGAYVSAPKSKSWTTKLNPFKGS